MKILLGGIPLGCDNIGDEAILGCVIGIVRRLAPQAEITVSTKDQAGCRRKFGVAAIPLYGFDPAQPLEDFAAAVKGFDFFLWSGATGLSDYPALGCSLLEMAQRAGVPTAVWNVGMNDTFNPAFFKLSGRKLALSRLVTGLTGFNLAAHWEKKLAAQIRRRLGSALGACRLVVLRDPDSVKALRHCGPFPAAFAGADSAILQSEVDFESLAWPSPEAKELFLAKPRKIALCLSAQSPVRDLDRFAAWMDEMLDADPELLWVMIPMNPITDFKLMGDLKQKMHRPGRAILLNLKEPEEVQCAVGRCQLVLSSRLHLMILGLNHLVPAVGIARGSKISTYLAAFGLPTCGSTDGIDYVALSANVERLLDDRSFAERAAPVRAALLKRLAEAEKHLGAVLQ